MWGYTVLEWDIDCGQTEPHGVIIQVDNGDTQYLTISDYKVFLKNREKLKR
tara:strand:- start:6302 stop:6454 length:153 start_codon:yes stop_codon:yes gene_type:complete